ncbi:MAG: glycosyltransferase [Actinomycetes bacterium]
MPDFRSRLQRTADRLAGAEREDEASSAVRVEETLVRLGSGEVPRQVESVVQQALREADRLQEAGDAAGAGQWFERAVQVASHRVLHFDSTISPLVTDQEGFSGPFRDSAVARAVRGLDELDQPNRGLGGRVSRRSQARSSTTGLARPVRVLVGYRRNADFLGELQQHLADSADFDARVVNFDELPGLERFRKNPAMLVEQVLAGKPQLSRKAEEHFREHLEWADVVWIEWCTALAALMTRIDPGDTRIVMRIHSYEVFTHWPHLVNWQHIDDVVFVSEHLRDLAHKAIPGVSDPGAPQLHVLPLAMELQKMVRPKAPDARFNLALVGASKMVKDPRWAIDVLRRLREHDERYRLLLIGGKFQDPSPATHEYAEALRREEAELAEIGALERIQYTEDVPGVLEQVGVILSTSFRESFHIGLVEGAASGAVPLVRDWPFFPGAPRQLFPDEWVVDSPEQAAERVLATTADEATWRATGQEASRHVIEKWDWEVVKPLYDDFLSGRPSTRE